jgi:hypothetical protein
MASYTYLVCDLVTNRILALVPFIGVSYQTTLNGIGTFSASLPLSDPKIAASNWDFATIEARSVIYVLRDDVAVWGGIIWTRDYDSQSQLMHFQASTFESYYSHLPYGGTRTWTNIDQCQIVRDIFTDISAIGFVLPMPVSTNNSGVLRDFQVLRNDFKWVSDLLCSLQQLPEGFDFNVDVIYTPSTGPLKQLNLGFPNRGVSVANSTLVFEYPGNIEHYRASEDGTSFATDVLELGAGTGLGMVVGQYGDATLLTDGWPIMYQIVSRKDQDDPAFLDEYARGDLAIYRQPTGIAELHVRADMDPKPGTYSIGDAARVRVLDPRFPNGADVFDRIQSNRVTVSDDGHEDVTLVAIPVV